MSGSDSDEHAKRVDAAFAEIEQLLQEGLLTPSELAGRVAGIHARVVAQSAVSDAIANLFGGRDRER